MVEQGSNSITTFIGLYVCVAWWTIYWTVVQGQLRYLQFLLFASASCWEDCLVWLSLLNVSGATHHGCTFCYADLLVVKFYTTSTGFCLSWNRTNNAYWFLINDLLTLSLSSVSARSRFFRTTTTFVFQNWILIFCGPPNNGAFASYLLPLRFYMIIWVFAALLHFSNVFLGIQHSGVMTWRLLRCIASVLQLLLRSRYSDC